MEGKYEVYLGQDTIGTVSVRKEGLYYKFCCRCQLSGLVMYKLSATGTDWNVDIGMLVPIKDGFGTDVMIAAKRFGGGVVTFRVLPKRVDTASKFIIVGPDEPFRYISQLENAVLEKRNGMTGIHIL